MRLKILSIGEVLWEASSGGEERLAGAPFEFAAHATRLGHECYLLTAVGADERGRRAMSEAARLGVQTPYISTSGQAETGTATAGADPDGEPRWTIARPAAFDFLASNEELFANRFDAIYYGTLAQTFEPTRRATIRILNAFPDTLRFYDVNLAGADYDMRKVEELLARASVLKLSQRETAELTGVENPPEPEFCETQARLFGLQAIAITRRGTGCAAWVRGEYVETDGPSVSEGGFAAAFLHGVMAGWDAGRVAQFANQEGRDAV